MRIGDVLWNDIYLLMCCQVYKADAPAIFFAWLNESLSLAEVLLVRISDENHWNSAVKHTCLSMWGYTHWCVFDSDIERKRIPFELLHSYQQHHRTNFIPYCPLYWKKKKKKRIKKLHQLHGTPIFYVSHCIWNINPFHAKNMYTTPFALTRRLP